MAEAGPLNRESQREPAIAATLIVSGLAVLAYATTSGVRADLVAAAVAFAAVVLAGWRTLLAWRSLLALTILLILFLPIRRYTIPSSLPFNLEPYRIVVALIAVGWAVSLLIDPRVRLRRTGIDTPLLLFAAAIPASLAVNLGRYSTYSEHANKRLMFFASFFIVFYLVATTMRNLADVDFVIRMLVAGGAILSIFALIEYRSGYNVFNHLTPLLPLDLDPTGLPEVDTRGGHLRAAASAQHPIALGAALAMLVPLAFYAARTAGRAVWWLAALLILLGMLASGSRTAILMLLPIALIFLWLRGREVRRFWPALLPLAIVVHVAAPGAIGSAKDSFFPKGGLFAQQKNQEVGSGRVATLGPVLRREVAPHPILGSGFGTRITTAVEGGVQPNAPITDDEWLSLLAETGLVGFLALAWTIVRFTRMLGRGAKADRSKRGWLLVSLASSVAAYAIGMLTYDSFAFIQVTFLAFILLGLGSAAWRHGPESAQPGTAVPAS